MHSKSKHPTAPFQRCEDFQKALVHLQKSNVFDRKNTQAIKKHLISTPAL